MVTERVDGGGSSVETSLAPGPRLEVGGVVITRPRATARSGSTVKRPFAQKR
jgi:hypothetical protein